MTDRKTAGKGLVRVVFFLLPALLTLAFPSWAAETVVDAVDVQVIMPVPNGTQARAEAVVDPASGAVTAIRVLESGAGYGFVPRVELAAPAEGGTTAILAPATIANGQVTEVKVLHGGAGYHAKNPPAVWIESPNRRAVAEAVLTPNALTHVKILDPGSGYTKPEKS
jgi:hypothetical protein